MTSLQMEQWTLHYDANYAAVPWPYAEQWDEWISHPQALVHPCKDFGRVAPCDGLSETPSVPPNLPRLVPRGRYRMAIYHDADWLYVLLEAENGPNVVSRKQLDRIPHMAGVNGLYPMLSFLTPDEQFTYRFGLDAEGQPSAGIVPVAHGARRPAVPSRDLTWELTIVPRDRGELSCWRIARASLAQAMLGNTLRVSISRMHFETMETVAWGAPNTWGPRPDEFGTVRLVGQRRAPTWPIAKRVEMRYDPTTERARFRVEWNGVYHASETDARVYLDPSVHVPWLQFALHLNGERRLHDLADSVTTDEMAIPDGHNRLAIASVGGRPVRLTFEKRSGRRILDRSMPSLAPPDHAWVLGQIRRDCQHAIDAAADRSARGKKLSFRGWQTCAAASLGRVCHYLHRDPRLLDVLREHADLALSLQREDGSFAGLHLERHGCEPMPWRGGAFDTGPAGELWVVAAWLLQEPKYLEASNRLVHAYKDYRVEFNYNYAALALYHLVAHYRLTREPLALEHALYYAQHCVCVDLLPLGCHAGHNYYTCYGSITLRGMAQLCAVLPDDHPYRATLLEQCIRMTNQVLARQQPDGSIDGLNRFFLDQDFWPWGLFSVIFLLAREDVARLDAAIQRMLRCPHQQRTAGQLSMWAESDFVRYWVHREALLAGEKIDLMTLL